MPPNNWFWKGDTGDGFGLTKDQGWFDNLMTIKPEPLAPLANSYKVTARKNYATQEWYTEKALGQFGRTGKWWNGRPVFRNGHGWVLHHGLLDHGWMIGKDLGEWHVKGSFSMHDPADRNSWNFGKNYANAILRVTRA